ncbi:hypothetical protein AURDEDRAFT_52433 [Auricularia subglabra TFB-10046 SS5]|nr:hypothetical protein AURDEDRAFT_52433 [Auricularia subglabra TFB-10046 SS5]
MAPSRTRKGSPIAGDAPNAKRQRLTERDVHADFHPGLLEDKNTDALHAAYAASEPYKHAVIEKLFNEDLLKSASEEIIRELAFTEKETDIYKARVHQTGDLASLSYLTPEQVALLPSLVALRDALYSPEFRAFVRKVTGCGPLSGGTQDMSVNSYRKGCHLLNHDDVIGSRRVSYILYMPLPHGEPWKAEYGGALELYPMLPAPKEEGVLPEPDVVPSNIVPPAWNQFVFFEIQPGKSFHSVEEVVVDVDDGGKQRLSVSGWFHKPQPGEEGYSDADDAVDRLKSSLEQLQSDPPALPMLAYPEDWGLPEPLTGEDLSFLGIFLNRAYLSPSNLPAIAKRFAADSQLQLVDFLIAPLAERIEGALRALDVADGLAGGKRIPPHGSGVTADWRVEGPPHKRRFCALSSPRAQPHALRIPEVDADGGPALLRTLQNTLLASKAFRHWLMAVSSLVPMQFYATARRFRPGLDYTLATSNEDDARLDVVLDLTPRSQAEVASNGNGKAKESDEETAGWESGEWGGWICYMAPHDGDDDPAVYRSGSSNRKSAAKPGSTTDRGEEDMEEDGAEDDEEEEEDDDAGTLLTVQPAFNRLLLVLRDASVMHFVKYVSAAAEGSRWDVCGEWEVGMVDSDSEGEGEDGGVAAEDD